MEVGFRKRSKVIGRRIQWILYYVRFVLRGNGYCITCGLCCEAMEFLETNPPALYILSVVILPY